MLKFTHVGATIAAIFCTQITSSLLLSANAIYQPVQAHTSNLVVKNANFNATTDTTNGKNSILIADANSNTPEVVEKIAPAGILLGLAVVGGAIGVALSASNTQPLKSTRSVANSSFKSENSIRIEQANRKLRKKLLRLLHDERDTANRLLSQVKLSNPNRSIDWCVEKVIYDLERDRGGY